MKPLRATQVDLRSYELGEDVRVRIAALDLARLHELEAAVRAEEPGGFRHCLLRLPDSCEGPDMMRALRAIGPHAHRLVLVATSAQRWRWGALAASDVGAISKCTRVLVEENPVRAVIATLQWLRSHDTFLTVWPGGLDDSRLRRALLLGRAWRAAWESCEDDDLTSPPSSYARQILETKAELRPRKETT